MNKFFNYIKNGKGCGVKYLLVFAFVMATLFGYSIYATGELFVPSFQSASEKLLPIKIEKGEIVEPKDVIRKVRFDIGEKQVPVVLDTTIGQLETTDGFPTGVYVTRKFTYVVLENTTNTYEHSEELYLPKDDYVPLFKRVITYFAVTSALLLLVLLFAVNLAFVLVYGWLALSVSKIMHNPLNFRQATRLTTIATIVTSLVILIITMVSGLDVPLLVFLIAVLGLQILIIKALANK